MTKSTAIKFEASRAATINPETFEREAAVRATEPWTVIAGLLGKVLGYEAPAAGQAARLAEELYGSVLAAAKEASDEKPVLDLAEEAAIEAAKAALEYPENIVRTAGLAAIAKRLALRI